MTVTAPPRGLSIEAGRAALLDYLRARLTSRGHPPVRVEAALPEVLVLGVHDMRESPGPPGADADTPIPIQLTAGSAVLGPVHARGSAARPCRQCLTLRWQRSRPEPVRTALERGHRMVSLAPSPYLTPFALHAIWRLWDSLTAEPGERTDLGDGLARVYELHLKTLRVNSFALIVDSACPTCRPRRDDTAARARLDLVPQPKSTVDEYHPCSLAEHVLPVAALTNPVCGMIGNQTLLDLSSPTTSPSVGTFQVGNGRWRLHEVSWSGQTDSFASSKVAGLLEGLERYAGIEQRRLTEVTVDALDNLGDRALDPRECGVYADETYESSVDMTPFEPSRPISWVWGYSLRDERAILVPKRIVYYGPGERRDNFVHECSNGCASGTSLEEAVLHGMIELIERDSFLLAWYGKARLPEIDPASCPAATGIMADRIRLLGYDLRLFDARINLGVPAVIALAVRRDNGPGRLCFAAGASLDPRTAVHAALSEVASYVPAIAERVTERPADIEAMANDYHKVVKLADHPALFGLPRMAAQADFMLAPRPKIPLADLYREWETRRPRTRDLHADLLFCQNLLTDNGFDVIVVDQTSPEQEVLGLRTACVIVPGLIPIDFGWSKQRALHMPRTRTAFRRAGWRTSDLDESELHHVPHPFP